MQAHSYEQCQPADDRSSDGNNWTHPRATRAPSGERAGRLDQRLCRHDFDHNLIDRDLLTDQDLPFDDLGFFQSFADVRSRNSNTECNAITSVAHRLLDCVQHPVSIGEVVVLYSAGRVRSVIPGHPQDGSLQMVEA